MRVNRDCEGGDPELEVGELDVYSRDDGASVRCMFGVQECLLEHHELSESFWVHEVVSLSTSRRAEAWQDYPSSPRLQVGGERREELVAHQRFPSDQKVTNMACHSRTR